eukprot:4646322-Alexandrium_andersonii.AAC.1
MSGQLITVARTKARRLTHASMETARIPTIVEGGDYKNSGDKVPRVDPHHKLSVVPLKGEIPG